MYICAPKAIGLLQYSHVLEQQPLDSPTKHNVHIHSGGNAQYTQYTQSQYTQSQYTQYTYQYAYIIPHSLHSHLQPPKSLPSPSPSPLPSPPLPVINCALGLWRFVESSQHRHDEQFYIYIALLVVVIVFEVSMGLYHFIAKYIKPDLSQPSKDNEKYKDIELTETTNGKSSPDVKTVKPPAKKKPSKVRECSQLECAPVLLFETVLVAQYCLFHCIC